MLKRSAQLSLVLDLAKGQFTLSDSSLHGPWHWARVERNAIALAEKTPGADLLVVRLFAILHDCHRRDEGRDAQHGQRAAEYARGLHEQGVLGLDRGQSEKLLLALRDHDKGMTSPDPTIGVCWDADRLELTRVGIVPSPLYFSTVAGRQAAME